MTLAGCYTETLPERDQYLKLRTLFPIGCMDGGNLAKMLRKTFVVIVVFWFFISSW